VLLANQLRSMTTLSKEELSDGLKTKVIGKRLFVFDSIDSTNACAKTLAEAGTEEGSVVISEFQTQGRGRQGHEWKAEPRTNLLFSTLLRPQLPKEKIGILTFFAAVSVARAIERLTGRPVECKWPNDLMLNGKKLCGILLENSVQKDSIAYSVIGVGLNVNQEQFDAELESVATSLSRETGKPLDRKKVFQYALREMDNLYGDIQCGKFETILSSWNERCSMFGRPVSVTQAGTTISGKAVGLSADGGLVVETQENTVTLYAGDVHLAAKR
jgi:BirA family transcriptional regulator, biotin operon repressor / biotin---[acetyl-CoA-carboxylase] ligase